MSQVANVYESTSYRRLEPQGRVEQSVLVLFDQRLADLIESFINMWNMFRLSTKDMKQKKELRILAAIERANDARAKNAMKLESYLPLWFTN